ncbi:hypothetical protein D9Q98_002960 [Chlorella vulgaris]|uniref:Uncharacterized protein n=1 Tax=Chlorella vulgaris TaxID=3077 RepID=A0A9D4TUD7_CHLVU|nr:hypothetical protein D9Q98_002960 [Chlorella vulgaris]
MAWLTSSCGFADSRDRRAEPADAGQRLRQAAAAARNEKLRGAARQLRSVRAPAQASTSTQQAARAQPIAGEAATSLPHSAACSKDEERPGGVHVAQASAVAAVAAWPSDSDPDDVLEELSLAMLTRRRLGLAPSAAALPAAPCCARRALLDASADAELPCLAGSRQQQQLMSAACSPQPPVEPARAAVHTAVRVLPQGREQQETGEQPVTVHAIVDLQAATAAMQVQLEQLRCALRSPALQSVPPRSVAASVLEQPAAAAEVVQACSSSSSNDGGSRPSRNEGSSSGSAAAAIQPHQPAQHEEAVAGQEPADNHAAAASCGCDGDGEAVQLASRPQSAESSGCATPARCGVHDSLRSSGAWSQCTGQLDGLIDGTIGDLLFGSGCSDGGQAAAAAVDKDMPVLGQEVKATEGEEEQEEEPQKGACRGSLEASLDGNLALAAAAAASGTSA